ncbi:aldolase [Penicillium cataractarum]|uniref:Aldolase n=1 Tax=Penicillium cataractarum TaxID=2100454 RepID=A0A9W9RZT5_9EURO|nr:aldolase [Penicillium cataractarum]KAJ5368414.1 aldolase [Penicillium cataractarum]
MSHVPPAGIYPPLVTYFNEDESIDYDSVLKHIHHVVKGGVAGLVLQGSNGEAVHLLHDERQELVKRVRQYLVEIGHPDLPIIVGCGAFSVRETLLHIEEAKNAGADYALVLAPAYWVPLMSPDGLKSFFGEVADASPLPILIYNYPDVTGGINISSETIIELGRKHKNIVGVKLTCGDVGKLNRIQCSFAPGEFAGFAGKSDFLLPALVIGTHGAIVGSANAWPFVHAKVSEYFRNGQIAEARELQTKLSHADDALMRIGAVGVKATMSHYFGCGTGRGRRPFGSASYLEYPENLRKPIDEMTVIEKELSGH